MYEELYVIKDNERFQLDLNNPSGITLNFKSNLFGDLSKISCSFTYTFKLPLTANNRRVLDMADDIRHPSGMIRKRLKAEFYQNGINLFGNANLYISEVTGNYSAVLTWDVNDSLEKIKDEDISLNALGLYLGDKTIMMYEENDKSAEDAFINTADVLRPMYNCGLPFYLFDTKKSTTNRAGVTSPVFTGTGMYAFPMPVVPVYRLLQAIEQHFGLTCQLGKPVGIGGFKVTNDPEDIITRGVIPLVAKDVEPSLLEKNVFHLNGIIPNVPNVKSCDLEVKSILSFNTIVPEGDIISKFLIPGNIMLNETSTSIGPQFSNVGVVPLLEFMKFEYDGCITLGFDFSGEDELDLEADPPMLSVCQMQSEYIGIHWTGHPGRAPFGSRSNIIWKEFASIEGELVEGYNNVWRFDFAAINGQNRLECEGVMANSTTCFICNYMIGKDSTTGGYKVQTNVPITAHLVNEPKCVSNHPISMFYNLPDISCQEFIKVLFYMIGAYPSVGSNGQLIPKFYTEIKDNLSSGKIVDWSSKDNTQSGELPTSIKFELSDFAQRNYYLMKSDELEKKTRDVKDNTDVYENGIGYLLVDNDIIEKEQTVIQVPFNAPYIQNRKTPAYETGNTYKVWALSEDELPTWVRPGSRKMIEFCDPAPCYGVITNRMRTKTIQGETSNAGNIMTMEVWNGFKTLLQNPSFAYLQQIISDPYIVKLDLRLTELDLANIDYSVPVYLEKFNSFFAIVSIQRNSKGDCTCELIKLPS